MDPNELLLRHARGWATEQGRSLDVELLRTILGLRSDYDDLPPTLWSAGSAEHLMLVRWPAHGPAGAPDVSLVVDTLETWWRFLRATGRMASASADRRVLVKEAGRAARTMAAVCSDMAHWSPTKVLEDFGRSIGISLEGCETAEELGERFARITEEWNALPTEERRRRMPGPVVDGGPGLDLRAAVHAAVAESVEGIDDDALLPPSDAEVSARQARASGFWREVHGLADWVGDGREVTARGVLRVAEARRAHAELDLPSWERRRAAVSPDPFPAGFPDDDPLGHGWRSAMDCLALERLWLAAGDGRLIEVGPRRAARAAGPRGRHTGPATDTVLTAMTMLRSLYVTARRDAATGPLIGLLLRLTYPEPTSWTLAEARAWWQESSENLWARMAGMPADLADQFSQSDLDRCLLWFADTGLWEQRGDRLVGTELGWDFARILIASMGTGEFDG